MLNKDQYNQEEYNDYYRQETEGAEIKGSYKEEGNGKSIIILLTLLLLGVAGYFGFTKFNTSSEAETSEKEIKVNKIEEHSTQNIKKENQETEKEETIAEGISVETKKIVVKTEAIEEVSENKKIEEKIPLESDEETNLETTVTTAIEKSASSSQKMSPEEIAKVVQLVMSQMNQQVSSNPSSNDATKNNNSNEVKADEATNDTDLLNALSESMVDTITENDKTDYSSVETNKNIEVKEKEKTVDTYNKVTIQTTSGSDELSRLSEQISSVIAETIDNPTKSTTSSTYTKSITKEVAERSNAMRIIIVKKGDTLGKIAKRAYGNVMDYKKIYTANPDLINRPDRIYIGQKLSIPE